MCMIPKGSWKESILDLAETSIICFLKHYKSSSGLRRLKFSVELEMSQNLSEFLPALLEKVKNGLGISGDSQAAGSGMDYDFVLLGERSLEVKVGSAVCCVDVKFS